MNHETEGRIVDFTLRWLAQCKEELHPSMSVNLSAVCFARFVSGWSASAHPMRNLSPPLCAPIVELRWICPWRPDPIDIGTPAHYCLRWTVIVSTRVRYWFWGARLGCLRIESHLAVIVVVVFGFWVFFFACGPGVHQASALLEPNSSVSVTPDPERPSSIREEIQWSESVQTPS